MNINLSLLQSSASPSQSRQAGGQSSLKTPSGQSPSTSGAATQQPVYGSYFSGQQRRATGATPELEAILKELESFATYDLINGGFIITKQRHPSSPVGHAYGCFNNYGYKMGTIFRVKYLISRLVWLWHTGNFPIRTIDHIDRDKLNNRIENLRDVSMFENNKNKSIRKNNKSGYVGISWVKATQKWLARTADNKPISIGQFSTLEEAITAREEAIKNNPQWGYSTTPEPTLPNLKISIGKAK